MSDIAFEFWLLHIHLGGNFHPMPIAEAWDGTRWTVDLSLRSETVDLETTAIHHDLQTARSNALTNLKRLLSK